MFLAMIGLMEKFETLYYHGLRHGQRSNKNVSDPSSVVAYNLCLNGVELFPVKIGIWIITWLINFNMGTINDTDYPSEFFLCKILLSFHFLSSSWPFNKFWRQIT